MSATNVNLRLVLSDTRRIIRANRRHFTALSLLFVFPLSFSAIVSSLSNPTYFIPRAIYTRSFSSPFMHVLPEDEIPPPAAGKSDIIFTVIISLLFHQIFSLFTTASITCSILNGFFSEPVKFTSSLKSILVSFLPLAGTRIVSVLILALISAAVAGLGGIMYVGILSRAGIGSQTFTISLVALLMGVMVYIQLEWYLADVIIVVESKWGFAPLRRSSYLVKGMKSVAFSISVLFSLLPSNLPLLLSRSVPTSWIFVLQAVAFTGIATILRLYSVAATAVLFIYSKGLRGELATEIAHDHELASLNVGLPHDKKVVV